MENFIEKIHSFSFIEFMSLGLISFIAWEISDFLLTKIINKFNDKKGCENNEEK